MPDRHALLGPSGAHRWLACPPSARLEAGMEDTGSEYAREGTLAHRLAEIRLREKWEPGYDAPDALIEVTQDPLYSGAMWEHTTAYLDFIAQRMAEAKKTCEDPRIFIEQEIHYEEYVPEGFGTSDCVILSDGIMEVIDFKYGQGVPVDAEDNPQMKLYALGAYLAFSWAYRIQSIHMTIFQPRLDSVSTCTLPVESLLAWADAELKTRAREAWEGAGEFGPGEETCRWCKIAATCKARAQYQLELAKYDFADPALLTPEEIAHILSRKADFEAWLKAVKEKAEAAALSGVAFPGFKLVEGRSNRRYADEEAIAAVLCKAGFQAADLYRPKALLGLTEMEKLVGRKQLAQLAGAYIIKPEGAPTLVPEGDKRPAIHPAAQAANDFKEEL